MTLTISLLVTTNPIFGLRLPNSSITIEITHNIRFEVTFMELEAVAKALKELGHPTRLSIYKEVVKAGYQGVSVGNIQDILGIPASTLSHHVASLASAGLIHQRREGRTLYCVAEYECLNNVIGFLRDECCLNEHQCTHES